MNSVMVFATREFSRPWAHRWLGATWVRFAFLKVYIGPRFKHPPLRWHRVYGTDDLRIL